MAVATGYQGRGGRNGHPVRQPINYRVTIMGVSMFGVKGAVKITGTFHQRKIGRGNVKKKNS